MDSAKGFLPDFINKKLALYKAPVKKEAYAESFDAFAKERYKSILLCLTNNSRQELKNILKLSPPFMNEREATEEFLEGVSMVADEFSIEFSKSVVALARIAHWKDDRCPGKYPEQFILELDAAIKEIFPDTDLWGNIAWGAIVKNSENFLKINFHDIMALSVYSRAVNILVSYDNKITKQFFESFRTDLVKAIIMDVIQPIAYSLGSEKTFDNFDRHMLLDKLSLLQTCLLTV
jgi:hypothetical protein